ncbi:DUF4268 domain-containing protein [Staphylococcus delphini]|uniref:DUF4268 domain-containing protein n=1 Tax=Staphylococcus delphini TaxID=53344 RepID=UPI000BBBB867|nr:DUF4268 domain-containing protein [Staphylococcus delphini]PCF49417.1 hypothetical protein B5C09_03470 [Staphylococcus delphini]
MSIQIGRLKEVNIKDLWIHEQYNFSNWLAKEENITLLNEAIDLTLTDIEKEVYVGSYRCDLVATDETTGIKVIIENQLEATNHEHLGKIITYASGLGANVIIWVVKQAREEHRSAIEWLNNNTVKNISFFLIEIHAYKIGDSLPAPKFEVIEEPNDFLKSIKNNSEGELNKSKSERLYFWTEFNQFITDLGKPFNIRKATTNHSYSVAIGTSEAHINVILINKEHKIGIEIHIKENKDLFDQFYINKEEIEKKLGFKMDWQRLNNKKKSRIIVNMYGLDFDNKGNYKELITEIIDKVVSMRSVFREYL